MKRTLVLLVLAACGASHAAAGGTKNGSDAGAPTIDAGALADAAVDVDASDGGIVPQPRAASTSALRDVVGLSTHPMLGSDAASANERAFEWAKLAQLGLHRVRTDFTWATIEPTKGTFDFSAYDELVSEASAHGVDVLAILDYGVPWATSVAGADMYYPPDDPSDFAAFAAAVAQHFDGALHDFEIWNEPNDGLSFWKPTLEGDPAKYGALLLAATRSVLAAEPAATVAYAGTVYDYLLHGPDFVAQSLAATPGLGGALPAFAMHAYEAYPPQVAPESATETPLVDKVATMSGAIAAGGAGSVPIWITEIGWPVTTADPLAQQARYTVRAVILAALAGADRVYLYTLEDGPNPTAFPPEDAFGLVGYEPDWADAGADAAAPADKPAFVALQALLGAVGSYAVSARLPASPADVYLVELASSGSKAWIAWRATDGAPATSVTVPASGNVRVTRIDGSTTDDVATGAYMIQVGPDPIIVGPR